MADFFQPGPAKGSSESTPSAAQQALIQWKVKMLADLLNHSAGSAPSFKSFVQGGPAQRGLPGGMGAGSADVLMAMMQPGAFTSHSSGEQQGPTPSMFSDLTQLGLLGALLYKSGILGGAGDALGSAGGWLKNKFGDTGSVAGATGSFGNEPSPLQSTADTAASSEDDFLNSLWGSGGEIPMADAGAGQDEFLTALLNSY